MSVCIYFNMNFSIRFEKYNSLKDRALVNEVWSELASKSNHSFFLSVDWISTWLITMSNAVSMSCIVGYKGSVPIVAFFITEKPRKRYLLVGEKQLYINCTGISYYDILTIENNSFLLSSSLFEEDVPDVLSQAVDFLNRESRWDVFYLPRSTEPVYKMFDHMAETRQHDLLCKRTWSVESHYVDLSRVRASGMDYCSLLSANKRSQVRRSIKEYEKKGKIRIDYARSTEEAITMLSCLADLHQETWVRRGKKGSFSNNFFVSFHKNLIERSFPHKTIQLIKFSNDEGVIGYIYNFIHENDVLFYQCGFKYCPNNNNIRPGLVSHCLAITKNARMNHNKYFFLAGSSQYKASMSTDVELVSGIVIQKKRRFYFT